MMRAVGYVRVSSDEQAQHGISVEAQREILRAWAVMRQVGEIAIYEDPGFSGKNMQRPALQRLLGDLREGSVDTLVVWKLDRLSRSLRDTLTIIEDELQPRGITLVSVTENIDTATPSGRMMLNILASFAQLEREQDSDRVVMAHKHLAQDCRYLGGHVALGYRVGEDRRLELDPVTAPIVRHVFDLYLARAGYAEILRYLNGEVLNFCKRKTPWKKTDLNYLLHNEIYAGVYTRKLGADKRHRITSPETIRVPGGVPAIVTQGEWQRVSEIREENRSQSFRYNARVIYPMTGLVRCGVCGALMHLNHGGKARDGTVERYYTCSRRCVRPARLEPLEAAVCASLSAMADLPEMIRAAVAVSDTYAVGREADNSAACAPVKTELAQIRRRLAQITAWIADAGTAAPRTLLTELQHLEAQETVLQARLDDLRRPVSRYDADTMIAALSACRNITEKPPAERRALLQEALHAIQVTPDDYRLVLAWQLCGGDDPPTYICHLIPPPARKKEGPCRPSLEVLAR